MFECFYFVRKSISISKSASDMSIEVDVEPAVVTPADDSNTGGSVFVPPPTTEGEGFTPFRGNAPLKRAQPAKKCAVCSVRSFRYKCPKCAIQTCSMECCIKHKLQLDVCMHCIVFFFINIGSWDQSRIETNYFLFRKRI